MTVAGRIRHTAIVEPVVQLSFHHEYTYRIKHLMQNSDQRVCYSHKHTYRVRQGSKEENEHRQKYLRVTGYIVAYSVSLDWLLICRSYTCHP